MAPVVSVDPYPSYIGIQSATFKYYKTSGEIGAPPVQAILTLPPKTYFEFLKIIESHKP